MCWYIAYTLLGVQYPDSARPNKLSPFLFRYHIERCDSYVIELGFHHHASILFLKTPSFARGCTIPEGNCVWTLDLDTSFWTDSYQSALQEIHVDGSMLSPMKRL